MIDLIQKSDLPVMLKIWNKFAHVFTSSHDIHTIESLEEWFNKRKESNEIFYGVYVEHELKGFLIIQLDGPDIWLEMWAVDPQFQRHGFGILMLQFMLSNHRVKGSIKAEIKVENFIVLNPLIKYGFEIVGYDKDLNEYFLKRK